MSYAPIVLTVFKRPFHTGEVLKYLSQNELAKESDLYIFSDGPRKPEDVEKIEEVRKVIHSATGFKNIYIKEEEKNKGLANSIIGGVSDVVNKYGKVIVMEDDLLTQKYFLNVMNQMLDYYESDNRVGTVTAFRQSHRLVTFPKSYTDDIFFNLRPTSTGWGTWKNRWNVIDWKMSDYEKFKTDTEMQSRFSTGGKDLPGLLQAQMEGRVDSWAIRWTYHNIMHNLVTAQTTLSYLDNIGYDASGVHSKDESYFFRQVKMAEKRELTLKTFDGNVDMDLVKRYVLHNQMSWPYIKKKLQSKFGILIKF